MSLKIGFKLATDIKGKAMALALKSQIVHCELIFWNTIKASSWQNTGVALLAIEKNRDNRFWYYYELPDANINNAYDWFKKHEKKPYNWVGIFGGMFGKKLVTGKGYNCSDSAYVALQKAGVNVPKTEPEFVKPNDLYKMIIDLGYKTTTI